jgi:hypothetical protein
MWFSSLVMKIIQNILVCRMNNKMNVCRNVIVEVLNEAIR